MFRFALGISISMLFLSFLLALGIPKTVSGGIWALTLACLRVLVACVLPFTENVTVRAIPHLGAAPAQHPKFTIIVHRSFCSN